MEYPIYLMELKDGELQYGLSDIALVDKPAYESNFLKFSKHDEKIQFAIQDNEQRIITGALMIPDKLVLRLDKNKQPYYVGATKETIFEASQKFARENKNNNIKLTHETTDTTNDVFIFESFITNENRIKEVVGFETLPLGTWFITCKVLNETIWNQIKDGK